MKKFLSVILVFTMMLSIVACSAQEAPVVYKTEIIGEWMAAAVNAAATFKEDGTGELSIGGKKQATWKYDPATDTYIVVADTTYTVTAGKVYGMPYISINGMDFFQLDDYDNARTNLHSTRCEDIVNLTSDMIQIKTDETYPLADGVYIHFTNIEFSEGENCDGLYIDYMIGNDTESNFTSGLTLTLNAKYYLASKQQAFTGFASIPLASNVTAGSGITDSFEFSLDDKVAETVKRDGMVIGAIYFELNGQNYYIDLSFMGK